MRQKQIVHRIRDQNNTMSSSAIFFTFLGEGLRQVHHGDLPARPDASDTYEPLAQNSVAVAQNLTIGSVTPLSCCMYLFLPRLTLPTAYVDCNCIHDMHHE